MSNLPRFLWQARFRLTHKMKSADFVTGASLILCVLMIPGSFVGAFFLIRKPVQKVAGRVLLTILLGGIFLVAGVTAVVAGCSSIAPMSFR